MAHAANKKLSRTKRKKKFEGLRAITSQLVVLADNAVAFDKLTDVEKNTLERQRDQLRDSVDELIDIFVAYDAVDHEMPNYPHAPVLIHVALAAAFMIGSRAIQNPIMRRIEQEARKASTAPATRARSSKSETATRFISELMEPILKKAPGLPDASVEQKIRVQLKEKIDFLNKENDEKSKVQGRKPTKHLKLWEPDTIQRKIRKQRTTARSSG